MVWRYRTVDLLRFIWSVIYAKRYPIRESLHSLHSRPSCGTWSAVPESRSLERIRTPSILAVESGAIVKQSMLTGPLAMLCDLFQINAREIQWRLRMRSSDRPLGWSSKKTFVTGPSIILDGEVDLLHSAPCPGTNEVKKGLPVFGWAKIAALLFGYSLGVND
jgi:hypothetical protein